MKRSLSMTLLGLLVLLCCAVLSGCGGGNSTPPGGGDDDDDAGCRFEQAACVACIATECGQQADDCYGADWQPEDLCSPSGASAMCTNVTSASDGLSKQVDYASCVAGSCAGECG